MTTLQRAALALIASAGLAGAAQAQEAAAPAPAAAEASKYSDGQLKAFADALQRVQKVTAEYTPKISAATGDAAQALQAEMATKMHESLEAAGISAADYSAIAAEVNKDADLRRRVGEQLGALAAAADSGAPAN